MWALKRGEAEASVMSSVAQGAAASEINVHCKLKYNTLYMVVEETVSNRDFELARQLAERMQEERGMPDDGASRGKQTALICAA